VKILIIWSME